MNKTVLALALCNSAAFSINLGELSLLPIQNNSILYSVYYGEVLRIPFQYGWKGNVIVYTTPPIGSSLEYSGGTCYPLPNPDDFHHAHLTCMMNLVYVGNELGRYNGSLSVTNATFKHPHRLVSLLYLPISVTVIPHPLSMQSVPVQQASVNHDFNYPLKQSIRYYDENLRAGQSPQAMVSPQEQNGIRFDPALFSFTGKPQRIGIYTFKISVQNASSSTQAVDFIVDVKADPKEKPTFKTNYSVTNAIPGQNYQMNLMELIQPQPEFMVSNQITFHFQDKNGLDWLNISENDPTKLIGVVPDYLAGQLVAVRVIASSNTGGDSDPITLNIPIIFYDPSKKPVIHYFELEQDAGDQINLNILDHIVDPTHSSSIKTTLYNVEPEASWLSVSTESSLQGVIPIDAVGQKYQISLYANTPQGGRSELIVIPLQISVRKDLTPKFKDLNPQLPLAYPGQSFIYDFVLHADVYPSYEEVPYEIEFAQNHARPNWIKIKNNQLIAEEIPELNESTIELPIIIKNRPGGASEVKTLKLHVMN